MLSSVMNRLINTSHSVAALLEAILSPPPHSPVTFIFSTRRLGDPHMIGSSLPFQIDTCETGMTIWKETEVQETRAFGWSSPDGGRYFEAAYNRIDFLTSTIA